MVVALQKLLNPYFGRILNSNAPVSFKGSVTFIADPEVVFFFFFSFNAGRGGVKDCGVCHQSCPCIQPTAWLLSGLDRTVSVV